MKYFKAIAAFSTIGAVCVVALLAGKDRPGAAETIPPGDFRGAPSWQLQDVDGKTVRSSDFNGKVVILDFWATWCGPCREELPGLVELQRRYGKQGLAVVGVSVDSVSPLEVKKFAQQSGMNYPVVLADAATEQAYGGVEAVPTTFVIDREGRMVKQHLGFTAKEEFEKEIKPLLNR